jgi:hypothetical protein
VWLALGLAVLLAGVSLPWIVRCTLGMILMLANLPALGTCVLLRGPHAVRVLEWNEEGRFSLQTGSAAGAGMAPVAATLLPASFRLGIAFLVLWFSTPTGFRLVLIDGGRQDPIAFRRLIRHLARGELLPSRPKV